MTKADRKRLTEEWIKLHPPAASPEPQQMFHFVTNDFHAYIEAAWMEERQCAHQGIGARSRD